MAADEKWYFTKEQLQNTPSRKCGFDADKELSYRQQAANFIQDMGQKLQVSQLCINTAIVYMHRFYMFHSFTHFPWNTIAAASFFLAAKVEEQPRKLEHVIRVANHCLHREQSATFDAKSEQYAAQSQDLVFNENVLLQTLGFDVAIDHPHTHVVRCCHLVRASKDLAQTSYFMASNSLHLTTMCLQYKPTVVACFCIHLACKWSNWQIPKSIEGKDWFYYVDKSVTSELLEQLTAEFLKIFDKCPSRLKRKISSISTINQNHGSQNHSSLDQAHASSSNSPFDPDSRKSHYENKDAAPAYHQRHHDAKPALLATPDDPHKKVGRPHEASASQQTARPDFREYREKKERERQEREKAQHHMKPGVPVPGGKHMAPSSSSGMPVKPSSHSSSHHRPPVPVDPAKMKMHHSREHATSKEAMVNGREAHREHPHAPPKDVPKREYAPSAADALKVDSAGSVTDKSRYEQPPRPKLDPKLQMKHDPSRHRRELDPKYQKRPEPTSSDPSATSKKPALAPDKLNSYGTKPSSVVNSSSSGRHKSPFPDAPKSVPAPSAASCHPAAKPDARNGNHGLASLPAPLDDRGLKPWQPEPAPTPTPPPAPDDTGLLSPPPPPIKKASLFSPEKTPPHKKTWTPPPNTMRKSNETGALAGTTVPTALSPFGSPPPKTSASSLKRPRTSSSGSEPELRPVVQKLDQISGFENIIRDSKIKVPDIIQPICDRASEMPNEPSISKELKPPDIIKPFSSSSDLLSLSQPLGNGIETDPTMISNLLKTAAPPTNHMTAVAELSKSPEVPVVAVPVAATPVPPTVPLAPPRLPSTSIANSAPGSTAAISQAAVGVTAPSATTTVSITTTNTNTSNTPTISNTTATLEPEKHKAEHHHKSEKKKKKDKHKHKDKDKSKDEKKKKHKDKDKERHKSKVEKGASGEPEAPLKITIPKDKIQQPVEVAPAATSTGSGLKVKISKDRLMAEPLPLPPSSLKIKISKDQIQYNSVVDNSCRKREREKASPPVGPPPTKALKTSYGRGQEPPARPNGRNAYPKVAQLGDGEASQLRLAESKYHSKGASKAS